MAGLYLHIPFCKQACHYCNFHFATSLKRKDPLLVAMHQELRQERSYLEEEVVETIYFGGGTPSVLSYDEIQALFDTIYNNYRLADKLEITLEANPDDLTREKINAFSRTPINRFSVGIQSFRDEDLTFMNRAHHAELSIQCIHALKDAGFSNLTIDLIYGTPGLSNLDWANNLEIAFELDIPHLSCYCLTVEPKTALHHFVQSGKVAPVDEILAIDQFKYLMNESAAKGYEHYEISNFAQPGYKAVHNSNYWNGKAFLGIGPSAHSYNGNSRRWNIANNAHYIKNITAGNEWFEQETLSGADQYNEYVMTRLRTSKGINFNQVSIDFQPHFQNQVRQFVESKEVVVDGDQFKLTQKGKLMADHIASELFFLED